MAKERLWRMDNIKFILIACVVLGHLLAFVPGRQADQVYYLIYSFHMPAFMFITGFFAKFKKESILRFGACYLVFQAIYCVFACVVNGKAVSVHFASPYWIMWYLMATVMFYLCIPLFSTENRKAKLAWFIGSIVMALAVGYEDTIGMYLSLSRFFVFMPYFLAGFYLKSELEQPWVAKLKKLRVPLTLLCIVGAALGVAWIIWARLPVAALYGNVGYETTGHGPEVRALLYLIAACWIGLLMSIVPNRRIPVLSSIGTNSMGVYLFHGFVVRPLMWFGVMKLFGLQTDWALAIGVTIAILLVCGTPFFNDLARLKNPFARLVKEKGSAQPPEGLHTASGKS